MGARGDTTLVVTMEGRFFICSAKAFMFEIPLKTDVKLQRLIRHEISLSLAKSENLTHKNILISISHLFAVYTCTGAIIMVGPLDPGMMTAGIWVGRLDCPGGGYLLGLPLALLTAVREVLDMLLSYRMILMRLFIMFILFLYFSKQYLIIKH